MFREYILKIINKPINNIKSSQTLYEALFTAINMDLAYKKSIYKNQAFDLAKEIIESQLVDGGFDIGYNFSFGKNMSKKNSVESTTPEILSIFALIEFYDVYHEDFVIQSILKGIDWIKCNSYLIENHSYAIPYAPNSFYEVHISNGVSFAVATLTYYMKVFNDFSVKHLCDGMFHYLRNELIVKENIGYWNYFEKKLIKDNYYIKIDNYHIAQQLYYHMYVDKLYRNNDNKEIIDLVSRYLKNELKKNIAVPYIVADGTCSKDIHTWGYCALLLCALEWSDQNLIDEIKRLIMEKMWNGSHFIPIIQENGIVVDASYYPRSDAWVLHSLSGYLCISNKDDLKVKNAVDYGLNRLSSSGYIGCENHVLTFRKKLFNKVVNIVKKY